MNFHVANKNEDLLIKNHVSNNSSELSEIFNEDVNIAIWKRHLNNQLINASNYIINENTDLQFSELVKYMDSGKCDIGTLASNLESQQKLNNSNVVKVAVKEKLENNNDLIVSSITNKIIITRKIVLKDLSNKNEMKLLVK